MSIDDDEAKAGAALPERIRVLVVDDELPARRRILQLLNKDEDVGELLEAGDGVAAISLIRQEQPDVVFLDVELPGIDAFGIIEAIGVEQMPLVIFATACDRAVRKAWDIGAVDYLLKPFGDSRFRLALERAKTRLLDRHLRDLVA